jgi:hypothetical protein
VSDVRSADTDHFGHRTVTQNVRRVVVLGAPASGTAIAILHRGSYGTGHAGP